MTLAVTNTSAAAQRSAMRLHMASNAVAAVAGIAVMMAIWWAVGLILESSPRFVAFRGFAIEPTFTAFARLLLSGDARRATAPSLARVIQGLGWAFLVGAPVGLAIGSSAQLERMLQLPFQILRMVSPLAWMPIAVLAFTTWDGAIIFLIFAAAVWPIVLRRRQG